MKKFIAALCAAFALFSIGCAPSKTDDNINKYRNYCIEEIGKPCICVQFVSVEKENDDYIYHYIITAEDGDVYYCSAVVDNNDELMYIDCDLYKKGDS